MDYNPVNPQSGWELDLHSIYSAYIGSFQQNGTPYWDTAWGDLFITFQSFLRWGWPVIAVTSVYEPYEPHIVTTSKSLQQFLRMIKTRYNESLEEVPNITKVRPFEKNYQPMRYVDVASSYQQIYDTLPAVALAALKERIRGGDSKSIEMLWNARDKTFLAIDFEWAERDNSLVLEFGYAALRARHLATTGNWPPVPETNYRFVKSNRPYFTLSQTRRGHIVVAEHIDKVVNKKCPTFPRAYAFGRTHFVPQNQFRAIIQSIVESFASPNSQTQANDLVLVAHGISGDLQRLEELKIVLPSNVLILDTTSFERHLFRMGKRPTANDPVTGSSRHAGSTLSLSNLLRSLGAATSKFRFHNSGNDSFGALMCLQILLEPTTTSEYLNNTMSTDGIPSTPDEPGFVVFNGTAIVVETEPREERTGYAVEVTATRAPRGRGRGRGRRGGGQTAQQQQTQRNQKIEDAMKDLSFD